MKATYIWLSRLIAIGVVLQAMFIAFGMFDIIKAADDGKVYTSTTETAGQSLHSIFGSIIIPLLALGLLIISFFARIPGGVKWAAITFGLVVLQFALAAVSFSVPFIGLLHGLNAFAMAAVAGIAGRRAQTATTPVQPEAVTPA
jgi:hypothetical protein